MKLNWKIVIWVLSFAMVICFLFSLVMHNAELKKMFNILGFGFFITLIIQIVLFAFKPTLFGNKNKSALRE